MTQIERTDSFIASLGVEAYRVGGSVRDEILGRPSKDADYIVRGVGLNALGAMLREALKKGGYPKPSVKPLVLRDGRQAGWRASARGIGVAEIVLPRTEAPRDPRPGENTHRAFDIRIDPSLPLCVDAQRRDFTFNALYKQVGPQPGTVIDPTSRGLFDLQHKLVCTTHADSFRDDPLRTLRALRFVSVLGYDLSTTTRNQMIDHAAHVTGLSAKGYASGTVLDELSKLLMGDDAVKALRLARDTGVLAAVLPELAPMLGHDQGSRYHDLTTDEHTFKALETAVKVDAPLRVRWALLFHDSGKPECQWTGKDGRKHYYQPSPKLWDEVAWINSAGTGWTPDGCVPLPREIPEDHEVVGERIWRGAADRLGADKRLREDVAKLIRNHMVATRPRNAGTKVRRMRVKLGDDLLRDLYMHRMCDITGKVNKAIMGQVEDVARLEALRQKAQAAGVPSKVTDLAIDGNDCMASGVTGRDIGRVLAAILDEVVCDPREQKLTRDWQMSRIPVEAGR